MRLNSFLLPALAGVAAADAAPRHAEAYMLRHTKQTTTSNPPSIPNFLAEAILLQRLSSPDEPSALGQIPESLDEDEAISYINQFAKPPRPLFDSSDAKEPKQLVIAFSGVNPKQYKQLKAAIPRVPLAFTAPGLSSLPAKASSDCAFGPSINPKNSESSKCWSGKTQYLQYDVTKDSDVVKQLSLNLAALKSYADEGLMETTIVFLDEKPSSKADELRRRQLQSQKEKTLEEPSTPGTTFVSSTHSSSDKVFDAFAGRPTVVPNCFVSQNACETATSSCSGHGVCVDRWGKDNTDNSCFFCHCGKTVDKNAKGRDEVFYWGGAMCQKRDISTPFWLFAGITITLVATVAFSIGLLFSVGEEKLPGVIGAGVSRSK
ncbi:hypothetical protein GQX73_g3607 [Xylaria multiplex]|uniref:Vacuolar sorting protein Vps3844 C-terminal domain-containing protein n=1 Tax=Xylaria multiplex TaxID=323545 RepID=A0A7C8N093_9PEZI|nr:hypothetical protein GQX73_g3607 [Xylaria multiplex]